MAAFRRCFIALAVLAVFAGLASAQVMTCSVTSQQGNINLRSESKAELVSDLVITCSSTGVNTQSTVAAPVVNITVTFNAPVTSKILQAATTGSPYNESESLLLIDDPQSSNTAQVAAYGTGAAQVQCPFTGSGASALFGCAAFPNIVNGIPVMSDTGAGLGSPTSGAPNIYQGVVSGNSLTFFGVPVIPPGTNSTRSFRVTNVRVNANSASGQIFGSVAVQAGSGPGTSGAGLLTFIQTVSPSLGTSTQSLSVKASGVALSNCNALTAAFAGTVSFTELFNNAFKQRVTATTAANSGQLSNTLQNVPGAFNGATESDFVPSFTVNSGTPGLADFGTRLKAVFSNLPSGARVFVSFTNVNSTSTATSNAGSVNASFFTGGNLVNASGGAGSNTLASFAALLTPGYEATPDTNAGAPLATANTTTITGQGIFGLNYPYFEITGSGNTATAVWEVLNDNPSAAETFTFAVFITLAAQAPTGTTAADLTYAPTTSTAVVPNFVDPGTTTNVFTITQCRTLLLYPYVTSTAGFDTGISVANTTADPLGTAPQAGTCTFNYYGSPTTAATTSTSIAAGTVTAFTMSSVQSNFSGYVIAVCNFQFAHGFAFVADWTSVQQSSAMGYLALVMPASAPRLAQDPSGHATSESLQQ